MKGKHAKPLAVPKRIKTRDLDEKQRYHQIDSNDDELFQEEFLQNEEFQEIMQEEQYEELQPVSRKSLLKRLISNVKQLTKKQITAFSTLTIMIVQMFSPYATLLSTVQAVVDPAKDPLIAISASPITEADNGKRIVSVTYALIGENVVGFDLNIKYDSTKIIPTYNDNSGDACEDSVMAGNCATVPSGRKVFPTTLQTDSTALNTNTNIMRITMSEKDGSAIDLTKQACATTENSSKNDWGYSPYLPFITIYFLVVDDNVTELTKDMLAFSKVSDKWPTGFLYIYNDGTVDKDVTQPAVNYHGFADESKVLSSIEVTTMPTDITYKNGEKLDFTNGVITIHYEDSSLDETKDIVEGLEDGSITVDTQYASNGTKKAILTYSGKTAEIPYYVLSGATLKTNLTKTTYDHGENLDFTGGEIDAVFTNSSGDEIKEAIAIPTGLGNQTIETNTTTADVKKNPVKLTYEGYTVDLSLTVNDPLDHITVNAPTTTTYNHGDTVSFAGGSIVTHTKSGATQTIPATDPGISISPTTADINAVTNPQPIAGGLNAGPQDITVSYQGRSAHYTITVNDTVKDIDVTTQPTAKNKYGEVNPSFAGLVVTVNTAGGASFTVNHNSVNIDKSSYNANTLNEQQFTVTYGGKTAPTKAKLKLQDYITDMTINFPETAFEYDTPIATVINGATYTKVYKSGATSSAEPISTGMISNYTQKPAPTLFNSSHEASQTINIKLTSGESSFDELPITKPQVINIKDKITGIMVDTLPSKTSFKYGDTFEATNGRIKTVYASGAQGNIVYMSDANVKLTQADGTTAVTTEVAKSKFNNGKATETVKVTYTKDGKSYDTTYSITILDKVTGISISTNPTKAFEHGATFGVGNGEITVTYAVADAQTISMSDSKVKIMQTDGDEVEMTPAIYDSTQKYTEHLKVTYMGAETTYDIVITNVITEITLKPSPKTSYAYQESTANAGGSIEITRKNGTTSTLPITDSMITGLNTNTVGTRQATVTYTENDVTKTAKYSYTVANSVTGATIVAPSKTTYKHGETLGTGTVTLTQADGTTISGNWSDVTITDGGTVITALPTPTEAEYKASSTPHKISKTLKLNYSKDGATATEVSYPIEIINDVKSIAMYQTPKQNYSVNDPIDLTGGEIIVTRAVGSEAIAITSSMTSGFDSSKEYLNNSLTITVTYTENGVTPAPTTSYNATVTDTVASIKITKMPKQNYKYDEPLDATAGKLELTRASGDKEEIAMTNAMVTSIFDPQTLGEQTLTVTYGGQTATYKVTVRDYVTGITVNPDTLTGTYNTSLADLIQNVKYQVTYRVAGQQPEQNLVAGMVSGYTPTSIQTQNLTVTYTDTDINSGSKDEDFTANLTVTLSNGVTGARITKPTNAKYHHGASLDAGTLTLINADGTEATGNWADVTVTEADGTTPVNMEPTLAEYTGSPTKHKVSKTLKLNYSKDGVTVDEVEYPIEIINDIQSIAMYTTPKQNYSVNDPIDLTGGEIMVTRAVGSEAIAITNSMISGFDSSQEYPDNSLTITVTYTENGITPAPTTSYTATVTDSVSSIKITTMPKQNYKYNEPLDATAGKLEITRSSGEKVENVSMTNAMITSEFKPEELGKQTLTVTYGGKTTTYEVTVKDYVTGITVNQAEVDGTYNQELIDLITNRNIMYTVTYAKAGALTPTAPTTDMITGYVKTDLGDRDITITYTDTDADSATNGETFSATVTVKTPNAISGAVIIAPTKTTYKDSESLAEGTITLTYANGDTVSGSWSDVTITNSDGTPYTMTTTADEYKANNHKISKTLKLNYNKDGVSADEIEYPIEIINDIKKIEMYVTPKQNYNIGDTLDLTNGEIEVTRAVGTETISLTSSMIDGFDTTAEHKDLSLTVEYTENGITKQTNYIIQVKDDVSSVTLKTTPKTEYLYGEPLDISTGELEVTRPSGTATIKLASDMIKSVFDPEQLDPEEQTITIEYGGFTLSYTVKVKDYQTGIVLTPPTKIDYEYGEPLDLTGGTVQKVMASGAETTKVDLSDTTQVTLSTFDPTKEGAQTITVDYAGEQARFAVIVTDNVQSIIMVDMPKQKYKYGEPLDINGGTILATRTSTRTEKINLDTSMVTGYDPNQLEEQTLTVTYKGATTSYTVKVEDYAKELVITNPNKSSYRIGEKLELAGATVAIKMASGKETAPVEITEAMIGGFDSATGGTKTISVTYEGLNGNFYVTVSSGTSSTKRLIIATLPNKLEYQYGEALDLTGGSVAFIKNGWQTSPIQMTNDMISGYSPNILGDQTITVAYEGYEKQFVVNVKDYISKLQVNAPTKTQYEYGETLDLEGGTATILMASGKVEEQTPLTASMITMFNNKQVGKQTIMVEYKGLYGQFQVIVEDKTKGISMNELPNKVKYELGDKLNITGATINVIRSSGITVVKVTNKMVSGFNPRKSGNQVITVTYEGMKTQFVVTVKAKTPTPVTPVTPIVPNRPTTPIQPVRPQQPVQEQEKPTEEPAPTPIPIPTPTPEPEPQKPTAVLGEKDEDNGVDKKIAAAITGGLGILLLLILLAMRRRNIKIYVEEDGEFVLAGTEKITRDNLTINLDQYLDGETYNSKVMICLNDSISDKLDGEEIEIKHRGEIVKEKIKYLGEPVEITLE